MKYTVGYLGNNEFIENELSKYYNPGEDDKIRYVNLSDISEDRLKATSFNGIIYDSSVHNITEQASLVDNIIKSNAEIDIMPIVTQKENNTNSQLLDEIRLIREKYSVSAAPCLVYSEESSKVFIEGIFSTLAEKTLRHIEKVHQYMLNSQKNMINVLGKFASVLEIKDPYTEYHSLRVANYAKQIAIKLGLPDDKVETIYQAGRLHDIGKIAILDSILLKNDKLDDKEFFYMRSHAELGEKLLSNIFDPGEFEDIKDAVKHHHERFDGRGYPEKISGEDISLEARILCLADSFDAMTTKRTYNNPKTLDEAILDLESNAGKQFDPKLTPLFIDLLRNEPEKLDITIDNGAIMVKYATKGDIEAKREQAKVNKEQETKTNNLDDDSISK